MKGLKLMVANWLEYAGLAIVYSLLAAAILEALFHLWQVQDPPLALGFRLSILVIPPLAPIIFSLLGPGWGSEPFRQQTALLELRRWLGPEPSLSHSGWALLLAVVAATTLLSIGLEADGYLRRPARRAHGSQPSLPLPADLKLALKRLADEGIAPFPILLVDRRDPAACTAGLRQPTILLSTGLVEMLDQDELEGVLAHEMAHGRRRDNWLGWLLFGLRLSSFYNPVALLAFHQIGHDMERICDAEAGRLTRKPVALASALLKVHQASRASTQTAPGWSRRVGRKAVALENRARRALVEDRIERLLHPEAVARVSYPGLRLGLAVVVAVGLAYLVV